MISSYCVLFIYFMSISACIASKSRMVYKKKGFHRKLEKYSRLKRGQSRNFHCVAKGKKHQNICSRRQYPVRYSKQVQLYYKSASLRLHQLDHFSCLIRIMHRPQNRNHASVQNSLTKGKISPSAENQILIFETTMKSLHSVS